MENVYKPYSLYSGNAGDIFRISFPDQISWVLLQEYQTGIPVSLSTRICRSVEWLLTWEKALSLCAIVASFLCDFKGY